MPGPTWVKEFRAAMMEDARNPERYPRERVVLAAKARMAPNGHASFGRGELAEILSVLDRQTGELRKCNKNNLRSYIRKAVELGDLVDGSDSYCLIVPGFKAVLDYGDVVPCSYHLRKAAKEKTK